jgi:hypothetical protein
MVHMFERPFSEPDRYSLIGLYTEGSCNVSVKFLYWQPFTEYSIPVNHYVQTACYTLSRKKYEWTAPICTQNLGTLYVSIKFNDQFSNLIAFGTGGESRDLV